MTRRFTRTSGYSLVEILMVVVIMALLATVSVPSYGYLRKRAAMAACIGNLRLLGVAFNSYMLDHDMVWPHCPLDTLSMDQEESAWWNNALKPYGVAPKHWICPADDAEQPKASGQGKDDDFISSYLVTPFDELPNSAFRWKQPWLIERTSNHGGKDGPNLYMPDGTIQQGIPMPPIPH